jgi:iron(III) transport system substrate-binding protein
LRAFALCALASCRKQPSGAAAEDFALVVYSSHNEGIVRVVLTEFRDRSGLRVRAVQGGTGEMLGRVRAGEACDVLWGGGAESLAANADLFEPYISSEAAAIPAANKAADGTWTGFTLLPMVIGYNSRLLPGDRAPRSWSELLEPRFRGAIAYADPAVSASSYTILRTLGTALSAGGRMSRAGAEAAFVANLGGKLISESSSVFPSVASGEYLVGLYHDEGARELMLSGSDLRIVYPTDGTSAVPDGVALVRGSRHGAAAKAFIDFVLGRDVAKVMVTRFHRRSARSDCESPPGQLPISAISLVDYDIGAAAVEKEATLARFRALRAAK